MPRQLPEHKKEAYFQLLIHFLAEKVLDEPVQETLNGYSKEIQFDWRTVNRNILATEATEAFKSQESQILILTRLIQDSKNLNLPQLAEFCDLQAVKWKIPAESWNAINPPIVKPSAVSELGPD